MHPWLLLQQMFLLPFLPVLFFTLSSLPPSFADAIYKKYLDCARPVPFSCGDLSINVSYPFLIDSRPEYCGYPGFTLTCDDKKPQIQIDNIEYQVKGVDYWNGLLTIVNQNYVGQSCPNPDESTTLDQRLFEYSDRDLNLTVFINCINLSDSIPALHDIECLFQRNGKHWFYYGIDVYSFPSGCQSSVTLAMNKTVVQLLMSGDTPFGEALQAGFSVMWTVGSGWCKDCIDSGGICGYDLDDDRPCFCPNGLENGSCKGMYVFGPHPASYSVSKSYSIHCRQNLKIVGKSHGSKRFEKPELCYRSHIFIKNIKIFS